VILTDRDDTTGEKSASDGAYDTRYTLLQNWRHDVVALASGDGHMKEWAAYTPYGEPYGEPLFEVDGDGTVGISDAGTIGGWIGLNQYDVRADADMDSDLDSTDNSAIAAATLGRGVLSGLGNRIGYAGYRLRTELAGTKQYARTRILDSETGRWLNCSRIGICAHTMTAPVSFLNALNANRSQCSCDDRSTGMLTVSSTVTQASGVFDCIDHSGSLSACSGCCAAVPVYVRWYCMQLCKYKHSPCPDVEAPDNEQCIFYDCREDFESCCDRNLQNDIARITSELQSLLCHCLHDGRSVHTCLDDMHANYTERIADANATWSTCMNAAKAKPPCSKWRKNIATVAQD
jgi:hypothetical protein